MSEKIHYSKAPITEATIDLRVTLPEDHTLVQLDIFHQTLGDMYSEKHPIYIAEFAIPEGNNPTQIQPEQIGYRFVSEDKRKIIQARLDGFGYTLLAPYDSWEPFRDEAKKLWMLYRELMKPSSIQRVAVRYINRLDIPSPSVELSEYLEILPTVSRKLPQVLDAYFMQLVIPFVVQESTAIINQGFVPPVVADTKAVVLDIDLFRDRELPVHEGEIWQIFERLREGKNMIFDACLTTKAKEMIL